MTVDDSALAHYLPNVQKLTVCVRPGCTLPFPVHGTAVSTLPSGQHEMHTYRNITVDIPSRVPLCLFPSAAAKLACRHCRSPLCAQELLVQALPGKDWMELVDCWSCHRSEFAVVTQRLAYSTDGEILGRAGVALHRGMFLIVALADVRECGCPAASRSRELLRIAGSETPTHARLSINDLDLGQAPEDARRLFMAELLDIVDAQGITSFVMRQRGATGATGEKGVVAQPFRFTLLSWQSKVWHSGSWRDAGIIRVCGDGDGNSSVDDAVLLDWPEILVSQWKEAVADGLSLAQSLGLAGGLDYQISVVLF